VAADQPATLLGYPVIEVAAMPDVATDSLSIAFGNFQTWLAAACCGAGTEGSDP
jgi:HK97 family phage major capsid protein